MPRAWLWAASGAGNDPHDAGRSEGSSRDTYRPESLKPCILCRDLLPGIPGGPRRERAVDSERAEMIEAAKEDGLLDIRASDTSRRLAP